ncbi:MAG: flagellar motor protein MotB [Bacteroidota bacterium]|nr:flagellar motor protein MotB [Bacteroidota bacterium]
MTLTETLNRTLILLMKLFTPRFITLTFCVAMCSCAMANYSAGNPLAVDSAAKTPAAEVRKSAHTTKGDKAFAKLKFEKALAQYNLAVTEDDDSLRIIQKMAECYKMLNDHANAEKTYARLADNSKANPINKYYYAEMLKQDKNYTAAMNYYQLYLAASPGSKSVKEAIDGQAKMQDLSKDNGAYKIAELDINTFKSEYAPIFYKDSQLLFTSNRSGNKSVYDKWALGKGARIYSAPVSTGYPLGEVKGGILGDKYVTTPSSAVKEIKLKAPGVSFKSTATYNPVNSELIFAAGSFAKKKTALQNGKLLPVMKLYSSVLTGNSGSAGVPLALNGEQFSNAQPSLSKDGSTLYFASDRLGGQGGTDLYVSTRNTNGKWSDPKNLGTDVNTQYDEKFPFIADDGTLYFSANTPNGIGGLDIYRTKMVDGRWTRPENLGAPINSSKDDFSFIINASNKSGFFASNRTGFRGDGADDIYRFVFDESKLEYTVNVRVVDANTLLPIGAASLALDCKAATSANTLAGLNGERKFIIDGSKTCTIEASNPGYKSKTVEVTSANSNGWLVIELTPDVFKVAVKVSEAESKKPVKDITVSVQGENNGQPTNYSTGNTGVAEMKVPAGTYNISSPDYPEVHEQFSTSNSTSVSGIITKEIFVPGQKATLNVPISGSGFTSPVTVSNTKTGVTNTVNPDANGEIRIDLKLNTKYLLTYEGKEQAIFTSGLMPGTDIPGTKFHVGQTWVIPNIYYDLNKWNIRKDASKELDNLVRLMKENPTLEIELSSHTDCRSSSRYNVVLSARRAKSAIDYVVKKGIKAKRFIAVGYGESRLTNNCYCEPTDVSSCNLEQHQANRRTEVRVLKY